MSPASRRWIALLVALAAGPSASAASDRQPLLPVEAPDVEQLEEAVAEQLREAHRALEAVLAEPGMPRSELAEAFGEIGRLYHAYGLVESAAACYANASSLAPGDFGWIYYRAVLAQQAGRLDEAIALFERSLELEPGSQAARVRLGESYLAAGRLEEAREVLEQASAEPSAAAAARAALGQLALSEKRYREAVEHLEAALAAAPEADRLHHPLGLAYRGLGDMETARAHLARRGKVGVKPPDPLLDELTGLKTGERVFLLRGQTAFRAGRYEEAAQAFRAALEALPASVRARVNLASALAQTGERRAAMEMFARALELDPDNQAARFNLGVLSARDGDFAGAAEHLRRAVALHPEDVEARLELARALRRLDRLEEALGHAAEASRLDPASEDAALLEAQVLVQQQRFADARRRLEEAHERMPEAGRVMAALAKVLAACPDVSQRDGPRALDLALKVYGATRDAGHAETVALALAETGRCDEAVEWQRQALGAARRAGAEALAQRLGGTLRQLERRPCRWPGAGAP